MADILDDAGQPILDDAGAPVDDGLIATPRSAAEYARALLYALPFGVVWPKDTDTQQASVAGALSQTFARLDERTLELLDDSPAGGALVEMLPEWESTLGLPDPCAGTLPTLALRQSSVLARLRTSGGQSIPYFVSIAAALGIVVTISEFRPFCAGQTLPAPVYSDAWAYVWRVNAPASTPSFARLALECTLGRVKPAHTLLQFAYT
jgi:uncharacterized protein YmfQ (DUF2313 family)